MVLAEGLNAVVPSLFVQLKARPNWPTRRRSTPRLRQGPQGLRVVRTDELHETARGPASSRRACRASANAPRTRWSMATLPSASNVSWWWGPTPETGLQRRRVELGGFLVTAHVELEESEPAGDLQGLGVFLAQLVMSSEAERASSRQDS